MKKLIFILLMTLGFKLNAQEVLWDQGIPFFPEDQYIVGLTEKIDLIKIRDSKNWELSAEEKSICVEIGLAFYSRKEYEAANWYFNKSVNSMVRPIESKVSAEKEKVYLVKEVFVPVPNEDKQEESEVTEMKKDLNFLNNLPKSFENLSKKDLSNLKNQIQSQIDRLIIEKDSLLKVNASKQMIESKDGTIKTLKKESKIIDLTIQNDDLNVENKDLEVQKKELRKYLFWAIIGISLLVLFIIAILQRKTIKVKDVEIENQLKDITKKNTYLEHAAKIIRHDMHSGINTYMPRGISSLEKKLSPEDIKNFKLESSIKMIKEGLLHTQKVYKNVYEFTNLVKTEVVLEKNTFDLKDLLTKYLLTTSYSSNVSIDDLVTINVNEILFCNAIDILIKNGLKYNNNTNKLVKIYMEGNDLVVEDNGIGLTKEKFEKILNKQNISEGDGLGLNICSTILQRHGFSLICEKIETGTKIKIRVK